MASISWGVSINYPPPFGGFLSYFSAFEFNFLTVECYASSAEEAYYYGVYLYSMIPLMASGLNWVIYSIRLGEDLVLGEDHQAMHELYSQHMHFFLLVICKTLSPFKIS